MKRIFISMLIVLSFVFASVNVYAEEYTEQDYFKFYGEYLKNLGLIKGGNNGELNENTNLTREESVVIILRMLGKEEEAKAYTESHFTDIEDRWSEPYINYAYNQDIVSGVGDDKFAPKDNVTIKQLFTLFLRSMGYTADWGKENVFKKGLCFGLGRDLDPSTNEKEQARRGDAFIIFANAIEIPIKSEEETCVLRNILVDNARLDELVEKFPFLINYTDENYTYPAENDYLNEIYNYNKENGECNFKYVFNRVNYGAEEEPAEEDPTGEEPAEEQAFEFKGISFSDDSKYIVLEFNKKLKDNPFISFNRKIIDLEYDSFEVKVEDEKVMISFVDEEGNALELVQCLFEITYEVKDIDSLESLKDRVEISNIEN